MMGHPPDVDAALARLEAKGFRFGADVGDESVWDVWENEG